MAKNITVYFADGSSHIYQGVPDEVTADQAIARAQSDFGNKQVRHVSRTDVSGSVEPPAERERSGFLGGIKRGTEAMISSGRTALGTLTGSPEEAARAGLARQEEQANKYEEGISLDKLKKIYEEKGLLSAAKEFVSDIPEEIGTQVPNIAAFTAGAKLGSKIPGPIPLKLLGGLAGSFVPSLIQQYGGGVESQAAAQQERGEPISIDRGKAFGYAVPEAALDVATEGMTLGRNMVGKIFGGEVKRLLAKGEEAAAEKLARESLTTTLLKGTATGALAEIPTEVAQTALDRLNAGRSLTDADALKDYGDTALQVSMLAPIGAVGRLSDRSAARTRVAEETARQEAEARAQAAPEAPPEAPPEVAPTQEAPAPEEPPEQQAARRAQAENAFQKMVMAGLQEKPTLAEFQSLTGLNRSAAKAEMDRMVDAGFLQKDEKSGRYSIVPEYSQFQFVEPGEKPRAALNEYPTEEAAPPVPPTVSRRQMDMFEGAPTGPIFYGNQEGAVGTSPEAVQQQAQQEALFRAHAENLQKQAEAKAVADFNAQRDKAQTDRTNVLEALKQDTSIKTIQDTLKVPYNDARKYMMGLRDDGIVEYKNNAWRLTTEPTETTAPKAAPKAAPQVAPKAAPKPAPAVQPVEDTTVPTAPKAPVAEKGPIFDDETYQKALDAVTANGKATVPVVQKATGGTRTQAAAFIKDLRDKGVTNGKNEVVTERAAPNGVPAESGEGGNREGAGVSVQEAAPGVGEPTEPVGSRLAGADDVTGGVARGEGEGEAPLTEKPRLPLPPETEKVLRKVVAADQKGAMTPELLDQIKSELNAVAPDYPLIHSLIDAATKPVKATLDTKTGEGMDLDLVRHEARRRIIRNIYRRDEKAAEAKKAPAPKAKVAPTKEKAPAAPVETKSVDALRSEYSSRAIDALGDEKISEETYDSIRDALKASNPDFKSIDKMLEGRGRRRAATEESAARGRAAAKEGKVKRGSSAKDLEDAADALLREAGYGSEGEFRFQLGAGAKNLVPHQDVVRAVKEATAGWRNAPKIEVVRSVEDLPERYSDTPEGARGFYDPAAKTVYVISDRAPSVSGAKATVFHESLGHYGLSKKFRGDLDTVLGQMYENPAMKNAADKWLKDNPEIYAHLPESKQLARAVEEVLAERSEAGPIKEGGLRGLYNRLVAFVRDWARRHGFGGKYSDNDITQILRQAHEEVIASPVEQERMAFSLDPQLRYQLTPDEQRRQDETLIRSYATAESKKPIATKEVLARGRETLSKLTPAARRGLFSSMNQNQLANTYERAVPSLRTRHDLLNEKGAYLRKQMDHVAKLVTHADEVLKQYSYAERQRIHNIFNNTTLDQIEVLDDPKRGWVADKANPLYRQFMALDEPVRDIYRQMRETYDNQSNVALGVLYSIAEPNQRQKFEKQLKNQRLKVYLPLFRTGDHWLSYTAEDGELVKRSFETTAERDQAYREAQKAGVRDLARYHNVEQLVRNAPPSGFFGEVMTTLKKSGVDSETINSIVDAYLNLMPAKSVLQMARKREGTAGFMRDTVQAFANVADRHAMYITNLKYNPKLDETMGKIREEAGVAELLHESNPDDPKGIHPDVKSDLMNAIETSHKNMVSSQRNTAMEALQYANYVTYLGGNVSTAFVTLMHLPTVAYPTLSRISGFNAARVAMANANKHAINYSYSKGKGVPADLMRVMEQGKAEGILGERRAEDIAEFKKYGTDKYLGIKARVDKVMNSTLGAADKHNREVTMLASYELNRAKLAKEGFTGEELHKAAFNAAKQDVYDTLGSVFTSARANILRHPLGQLFFTFKQDAMHRAYLLARAFKDAVKGESPEVKTAARKQLLGFYTMAGLLSGVSGMPLVGWAEMLAQLVMGSGDDDSYDVSEEIQDSIGLLPYKGLINYALNINAADRIGWDGMFWRDDPQRRSQLGFMNFAAEKMFGPMATYIGQDIPRAVDHLQNGRLDRAAESVMPRAAANLLKGIRYGLNGATTKDGVPIKEDVNAYNAFMQVLGFSPADLAEIQKENSGRIKLEKKLYTTKDALVAQFVAAKVNGDIDGQKEVIEKIQKFSQKNPGVAIKGSDLNSALTKHYKRLAQSVNGVYINPKIQAELLAAYPTQKATWMGADEEDEGEDEEE